MPGQLSCLLILKLEARTWVGFGMFMQMIERFLAVYVLPNLETRLGYPFEAKA
jgi:hypothetical protein